MIKNQKIALGVEILISPQDFLNLPQWFNEIKKENLAEIKIKKSGNIIITPIFSEQERVSEKTNDKKRKQYSYSEIFEAFWKIYPKKKGKGGAYRAWEKLKVDRELAEKIIASVIEHINKDPQWKRDGGQFIPHPATFLNQRRWEDEVIAAGRSFERAAAGKYQGI